MRIGAVLAVPIGVACATSDTFTEDDFDVAVPASPDAGGNSAGCIEDCPDCENACSNCENACAEQGGPQWSRTSCSGPSSGDGGFVYHCVGQRRTPGSGGCELPGT
jgi:hypothetical protein